MLLRHLGGLIFMLASARGDLHLWDEDEHDCPTENCSAILRKLTEEEQALLNEAVAIYDNVEASPAEIIDGFKKILKEHKLPRDMMTGIEILISFSFTAYEHTIEKRSRELSALVEMALPTLYDDEDFIKMIETTVKVPLLMLNKVYKEMPSESNRKIAQQSFRNLLFSKEYLNADEHEKKILIGKVVSCHMEGLELFEIMSKPLERIVRKIEL